MSAPGRKDYRGRPITAAAVEASSAARAAERRVILAAMTWWLSLRGDTDGTRQALGELRVACKSLADSTSAWWRDDVRCP